MKTPELIKLMIRGELSANNQEGIEGAWAESFLEERFMKIDEQAIKDYDQGLEDYAKEQQS